MVARLPIAAFALVLCCTAQIVSAQTTGSIAGTVTASADASPIASATVGLYGADHLFIRNTLTDATGAYLIQNLAAGTYYVRFTATGFVPTAFNGVPCLNNACVLFDGQVFRIATTPTPLTVTGGATTTANASLDRGGTISGTITRAVGGTAVANLFVELYDSSSSNVAFAITATDGTYSMSGLPFGTYYARTDREIASAPVDYLDVLYGGALCPGGATPQCRIDAGTPIVLDGGAPAATVNFSLPAGGKISGSIFTPHPFSFLSSYPVAVYQGSTLVASTTSDGGGGYTIAGLYPGTYFVRTNVMNGNDIWFDSVCVACAGTHPTPVTVTAGATSTVDFSQPFLNFGGISGTLTLPGISSITGGAFRPDIQVYNSDGTLVTTWHGGQSLPGTTSDTIQWTVPTTPLLPPGTYYLRTSSVAAQPTTFHTQFIPGSGFWVDELHGGKTCIAADCDPRSGTPVVIPSTGAVVTGINFTLPLGAQISGAIPQGGILGGTTVRVFDSRGVELPGRGSAGLGGYFVAGLPAGAYYLLLQKPGLGPNSILYRATPCGGCSVTSGTPVSVGAGEVKTGVDFSIVAARSIAGTVRSDATAIPANQPLGAITVEAFGPNGVTIASGVTLDDGTYLIDTLGAGTYSVRTRNARGFIDQTYATPVVAASDVTGIDFALAQGQTISGQVSAAGGGPLSGAGVLVYPSSPSSPAAHVATDSTGAYSATVAAGSYFVQTDPVLGYTPLIYSAIACPQGNCPTGSATRVGVGATPVTGINFVLPVCTAPAIAPLSLANAAVGTAYRQTLLVTGATGAVSFVVSSGALPPGLSLDPATGVLSGTPTASGRFTFTVSATDSAGCASTRVYTLDVPACVFVVGPSPQTVPANSVLPVGGFYAFELIATCGSFAFQSNASWISNLRIINELPTVFLAFDVTPNAGASRQGTITIGPRVVTVIQSGAAASPPFGSVDAPADGAIVAGSVGITGWALDDVAVGRVLVYRDPVAGEPSQLIFVGQSTFVSGARPDVAAAFPTYPNTDRAGWGYLLLTNMLPNQGNGTFRFSVFAFDNDNNQTLIETRTIDAVNASATAPFGAIDTPDQGAFVSGASYVNFGWALTPQPKQIPFDGSTIDVLIDGVNIGPVTAYNLFRPDVSNLFTGLKNSGGPVGYRIIDTTALSEGTHTIAWIATDGGGIATGIGSRYFTVQNSAWQPTLRANFGAVPPAVSARELAQVDQTRVVPARVDGVDLGRRVESLASLPLDANAARDVTMSSLQTLELLLTGGQDRCPATYAGYLVANGELRQLPVGSSIDPAGTFYWHPGPGFFGTYQLLFVRSACDGTQQRIPVSVRIQ